MVYHLDGNHSGFLVPLGIDQCLCHLTSAQPSLCLAPFPYRRRPNFSILMPDLVVLFATFSCLLFCEEDAQTRLLSDQSSVHRRIGNFVDIFRVFRPACAGSQAFSMEEIGMTTE